jgi:hypothetical protein
MMAPLQCVDSGCVQSGKEQGGAQSEGLGHGSYDPGQSGAAHQRHGEKEAVNRAGAGGETTAGLPQDGRVDRA